MIQVIFNAVTQTVTAFAEVLTTAFTSIMAIFYNATNQELTPFGVLLVIAFGIGIVYFALSWIIRLISLRGGRR